MGRGVWCVVCGVWAWGVGRGAWVVREDARRLRVLVEVGEERSRVLLCEAQVGVADELGPAEAVGAVGVAGLAGGGEEEHRLRVLVPGCSGAVESTLARGYGTWAPPPLSPATPLSRTPLSRHPSLPHARGGARRSSQALRLATSKRLGLCRGGWAVGLRARATSTGPRVVACRGAARR